MTEKKPTITIFLKWASVQVDPRQYAPARSLLLPEDNMQVVVEISLDIEHIYNATQILASQLGSAEAEKPILTPSGIKACVDALEAPFLETEEASSNREDWDFGDDDEFED